MSTNTSEKLWRK